jgi:hypothetical protein
VLDNIRDLELTAALRAAQEKYFAGKRRQQQLRGPVPDLMLNTAIIGPGGHLMPSGHSVVIVLDCGREPFAGSTHGA